MAIKVRNSFNLRQSLYIINFPFHFVVFLWYCNYIHNNEFVSKNFRMILMFFFGWKCNFRITLRFLSILHKVRIIILTWIQKKYITHSCNFHIKNCFLYVYGLTRKETKRKDIEIMLHHFNFILQRFSGFKNLYTR